MKIVVNHLTRMKPGYICVAGIDVTAGPGAHVRPVAGRLSADLLKRNGGPFDIASVVDLGATTSSGTPPETEDHTFALSAARAFKDYSPSDFWQLLIGVSKKKLARIFGPDLQPQRNGAAVVEGAGSASLGCLLPASPPTLNINSWDRLRIQVADGTFDVDLSVTDLRFYEEDQKTPRAAVVADVQRRIGTGVAVVLSVGLARAFTVTGDTERRHWLQVNNVHLEDDPTWQAE